MTSKIKNTFASTRNKVIAAVVVLVALFGGIGVAAATKGDSDKDEAVSAAVASKAKAAALAEVDGTVADVEAESPDGDDPADLAYEVEVTGGTTEHNVLLDKNFKVIKVETEEDEVDQDEVVSASDTKKAEAAALAEVKGTVTEVEAKTPDDDQPEKGEKPDPASLAFEVKVLKDNKEYEVLLDENFKVLKVTEEKD